MLRLIPISQSDYSLQVAMRLHYSQPEGFVGRNICYRIDYDQQVYGFIVGGSAAMHLPGRNKFFGISQKELNRVVNNLFFRVERKNNLYPVRNFTDKILRLFIIQCARDWHTKYGDVVIGFETMVEPPRIGQVYLRLGWQLLGMTKGYTCKRIAGHGTDSWSGKRVWNTENLRPKLVFAYKLPGPILGERQANLF